MEQDSDRTGMQGTIATLDDTDKSLLRTLQRDSTVSLERLATKIGMSKTSIWNRIQRLTASGVIARQVAVVDPQRIGLAETFFISIRTSQHNAQWLREFAKIVAEMPEIMEAHRLAGEADYLLKVQVASTREYDAFYKRLVAEITLFDVTSNLSMEVLKSETALPI